MNEHFVPIKVDREERPDVDRIYMTFVQATTGGGGWPMTVLLTPDLKPFFGGTYFPPDDRTAGRVSGRVLTQVMQRVGRRSAKTSCKSADGDHASAAQMRRSKRRGGAAAR